MKILFPIGSLYPSQQGGPSNTVYWMAKALTSKNVEVTCISTSIGIESSTMEFDKWLETEYGKVIYTKDKYNSLPLKLLYHSLKKIKHHDLLHLTSLFYLPSIILAFYAFVLGKKTVWSIRGTLEESAMKISKTKKKIALYFIKKISKRITFHSTSAKETENTYKYFGSEIKVIELPNYMDTPKEVLRNSDKRKEFLYIGRLHPIKAIDNLIQALSRSQIFMKDPLCILNIAGEGDKEYTMKLHKLVSDLGINNKIKFLGNVVETEKELLYANSFFTVLPSHSENFGNVVIESVAQCTPVIASKGTPWEILETYKCGFWVSNDPELLTRTIDLASSMSDEEYNLYRNNSRRMYRDKYDMSHGIVKWVNFYLSLN